jgi:hypothetical protein
MEACGQLHGPVALSPVPTGYEATWAPERVCRVYIVEYVGKYAENIFRRLRSPEIMQHFL